MNLTRNHLDLNPRFLCEKKAYKYLSRSMSKTNGYANICQTFMCAYRSLFYVISLVHCAVLQEAS